MQDQKSVGIMFKCNKQDTKKQKDDFQVHTFTCRKDQCLTISTIVHDTLWDYKKCVLQFSDQTLEFTDK